ncbi:SMI1/KNR4 family protein [Nonomuraea sp. NPDC048826]|uniref:SMI1/KNR4 family protein n=1 Tax=Nonomuraea sp. NPDC048826 TaxID=3364347 RepID=UPI0037125F2C
MRRLITSRGVWLALSAAVAAAVVVLLVRSRTRPVETTEAAVEPPPPKAEAPWPPAPILGTPTAEDLERYAPRPSVFDRPAVARFLEPREPRPPLDPPTRRTLTRWAVAGIALLVLAGGTYLMESAVFSKEPAQPIVAPRLDSMADDAFLMLSEDQGEGPETRPDADCLPAPATPRVRAVDPKVTRAVNRQWRRIETWLRANAPESYRALGRPAKARTIAVAEAQMGLRFPDDLRASLLRHNGAGVLEGTRGFGFLDTGSMSVREIRDAWRALCGTDDADGTGDPRTEWWDGRMIPFGSDDQGGHLVVDSVRRDVGHTDGAGGLDFRPADVEIRSHHALLRATADALETGGAVGYFRPRAVDGRLTWQPIPA